MMRRMNEQEKKEITEMTEVAKYLVLHDPQGFVIAKSNMDASCLDVIIRSMQR